MGVSNADRVRRWGAAHSALKARFAVGDARSRKKVWWRGRIAKPLDCRDDGQWARLQAVALSMSKPDAYDVRMEHEVKKIDQRACLDRAPRSPTIIRFLRRIFKIGAARHELFRCSNGWRIIGMCCRFRRVEVVVMRLKTRCCGASAPW